MPSDSAAGRPRLTAPVPCLIEEERHPHFFEAAIAAMQRCVGDDWIILVIDDGSTDGTFEIVSARDEADSRSGIILLSRNFGRQVALTAGLDFVDADHIAMMDADFQDPPGIMELLFHRVAGD